MKLPLNKRKKIVLARYWIYRLDYILEKELSYSDYHKNLYTKLKSYLIDEGKYGIDSTLHEKIELQYAIPKSYYNIDYNRIRDVKFPNLFKNIKLIQRYFNKKDGDRHSITTYHYYSKDRIKKYNSLKNKTIYVFNEIPTPKVFIQNYIKLKEFIEDDRFNNFPNFNSDVDFALEIKVLFEDMNKFLIAITPKPLSDHIETLLDQINQEKLNLVNTKEKQVKSQNTDDGMINKYGYSYHEWQNFTKQKQVEIYADMARKDTENTPSHWLKEFQKEFPSPKGYSVQLLRYKKEFKKRNRHEKFKKYGLMFYKGKE